MQKFGPTKIVLEGMAYFGIQSPLLKAHNLAHFINNFFDIELTKTIDFESFATGKSISFPCYTFISESDQCSYHLVGNKSTGLLFSCHAEVDFWFLVQFENGLNDHRFLALREKLYKNLTQVEQVFSVLQAEPKKLAKHEDFLFDFSEYCTKLLQERRQNELRNRR